MDSVCVYVADSIDIVMDLGRIPSDMEKAGFSVSTFKSTKNGRT